ncbi:Dam family site-specific DNA-(adenine-N6)-methyltransferase [Nisaea acidiphila]|uniref:Site-specific DNA-methyltransferase (adenine-specific) n=1 Tax=Nisaea acidiphila TaxID=1862145 RepID=A0A9J7AW68_9PROT|nr:Dam family site-specific DNA-(adenine-N6)-methyltransferase [Nisaea acidiphila]UUX49677.1 Dam family site-specific DNA-(adenine-N6)-methyltransferase [Nisaea acidiphila]
MNNEINARQSPSPILRWAGSKKRAIKRITEYFPDHIERYFELFAGSACVFFNSKAKNYNIFDTNPHLIQFYQNISLHSIFMHSELVKIPRSKQTYYYIRNQFNKMNTGIEKSIYFWYLNRNCFNGIYRENLSGGFNVPFSADRVAPYPTLEETIASGNKLSCAHFYCDDFESAEKLELREGDFIYLDPPYYVPNKRVFREYSKAPFTIDDFDRLLTFLHKIDKSGAKFLLSYPEEDISEQIKSHWRFEQISVPRSVSAKISGRKTGRELLFFN